MRYAKNLASLHNYCSQPILLSAINQRPRGTPILIGAGWRSQTEGETFKETDGACADPGTQNFSCHGGRVARATPSLIQSTFTSHTGSLLLSFLKKVTSLLVLPRPLLQPRPDFALFAPLTQGKNAAIILVCTYYNACKGERNAAAGKKQNAGHYAHE